MRFTKSAIQAAIGAVAGDSSIIADIQPTQRVFAHGMDIVASVKLYGPRAENGGSVGSFIAPLLPMKLREDAHPGHVHPMWRMHARFTLHRPSAAVGGDGGGSDSKAYDEGTCGARSPDWGFQQLHVFTRRAPVSNMAKWRHALLVDGELRVDVEVEQSKDRLLCC